MRCRNKALQAAHIEHKNWRLERVNFLRAYRVTPHSSTEKSPSELIFGRTPRTKLPEMTTCSQSNADSELRQRDTSANSKIRQRDASAKSKMKAYADTRRRDTPHDLHIGDFVLVRQQKKQVIQFL